MQDCQGLFDPCYRTLVACRCFRYSSRAEDRFGLRLGSRSRLLETFVESTWNLLELHGSDWSMRHCSTGFAGGLLQHTAEKAERFLRGHGFGSFDSFDQAAVDYRKGNGSFGPLVYLVRRATYSDCQFVPTSAVNTPHHGKMAEDHDGCRICSKPSHLFRDKESLSCQPEARDIGM
ncbi:hypothetical protein RvY_10950-4 [Ramazzottius varieornatus]|uniref:Uncharacterized protein n=1 Tax=Ramazzottius varieornatus TaxID=947166 RepID=A0A1D1VNF0_RAMVA|nr:hypothetical protein RvY_10950-4 [Ramazzottius varieornatus]